MRFFYAVALVACSNREPNPGWQGTPTDASAAAFDFDAAWPSADPDPDASAPAPEFDGGDGGTSGFACTGKTLGAGDSTITVKSGGLTRSALVHVPAGYDKSKGAMLVLSFHGFAMSASIQRLISRMDKTSDAHGFIVVYPEGVATSWNAGDCCGTAWTDSVDDVAFTKDLLTRLTTDYCIDPDRTYATGFSNGGFLAHRLACEMSDTFAAIAPVAGVMGTDPASCKPKRAVPVLDFHGTSDPIVPYNGGAPLIKTSMGPLTFRSVTTTMTAWTANDSCLGSASPIFKNGDATCVEWGVCKASVVHCAIDGGGHTWPGGVSIPLAGKTSVDISASETMYQFFAAHPR